MIDTIDFYNYLNNVGIDFFAGVPDSLLANFCACIKKNSPIDKNIITANEGNAVAMVAGYHLSTGKIGCVYMQNSGEGNAVNPLLSLADEEVYSIPMLLMIGWRGEPGKHDEPQHVKQGKVTLSLLEVMGIEYVVLSDNYKEEITKAIEYMKKYNKPYAVVVQKNTFSSYEIDLEPTQYILSREEALKVIIGNLNDDDFIVSTTGKTSREIFEIREENNQDHSNDFLTVGSMGHTASIAYGIASGTTNNVFCIDGDGSFIMHMGSLGVIGSRLLKNFKYILNDNNSHESVGGQPTCSNSLNIPQILKAFGFKEVILASTREEIKQGIKRMRQEEGLAMVLHTKQGSRNNLGRPTTTPLDNKSSFMKKIGAKQ